MFITLVKLIFDICCLRKGPQDLPRSDVLLAILVLAYCSVAYLMLATGEELLLVWLEIAFELLLVMGFVGLLLAVARKLSRYRQVLGAFLGTDAMISFFAIPSMFTQTEGPMAELILLAILALMLWHWVVCGHIIRHAISQSLSFGLGIAFLYVFGSYQLMDWFAGIIGTLFGTL